ncbi:FUSC family protein [Rouxiella sp. Mn2063]|uniref:FUSC family protein n=1 Tax=Rouxiella sp. Mn2063 TaxID=3395262 RepID=UPI003BBDF23D
MRLDKKISSLDTLIYKNYRIAHGLRIALAFILTFLIVHWIHLPEATWPLITLVVVMGPISFWGNVVERVMERILGTIGGSISGLIALWIEIYSVPLMLAWCGVVVFASGYLTLGKRPYAALLLGVTLAVVLGAGAGHFDVAMWRTADVIIGSLLSLLFASIYPQRAYIHWRMQMAAYLKSLNKLYSAWLSPNMIERPRLHLKLKQAMSQMIKMRALHAAASKESHVSREVFDAIQTLSRNLICTLELLADAYWSSRESHFIMLNAPALRHTQLLILNAMEELSEVLLNGSQGNEMRISEQLNELALELKALMTTMQQESQNLEAPIYGYVWLSMQVADQLKSIGDLIKATLHK